jgi:uridylate kinase
MDKKRILLKISGEVFSNEDGSSFDFEKFDQVAKTLADFIKDKGVELAIVSGAGNLWRYRDTKGSALDRVTADQMGMTATVFNAKLLENSLVSAGVEAVAVSDFPVPELLPTYDPHEAYELVSHGVTMILAGGTSNPYFTTDSAAALRALELECDILMKATKVDGVYSDDPHKNPDAERYSELSYDEVLEKNLQVMDLAAISLCRDNGMKVLVFDFTDPDNLAKVFEDFSLGTLIS